MKTSFFLIAMILIVVFCILPFCVGCTTVKSGLEKSEYNTKGSLVGVTKWDKKVSAPPFVNIKDSMFQTSYEESHKTKTTRSNVKINQGDSVAGIDQSDQVKALQVGASYAATFLQTLAPILPQLMKLSPPTEEELSPEESE